MENWAQELVRDAEGNVLSWEFNLISILTNDKRFEYILDHFGHVETGRLTLQVVVSIQKWYRFTMNQSDVYLCLEAVHEQRQNTWLQRNEMPKDDEPESRFDKGLKK